MRDLLLGLSIGFAAGISPGPLLLPTVGFGRELAAMP
jgi:hypothetical protein